MKLNREKLRQLASEIPVIILAGGLGTRLSEETTQIPKPMVKVGTMPIILHIMDYYAKFGFRNFAICGGYKVEVLRDYFMSLPFAGHDVEISFGQVDNRITVKPSDVVDRSRVDWNMVVLETGLHSMTGYRIAKAVEYLNRKGFKRYAVTYGDGLTDVDLHAELDFHLQHKRIGTVLGVHQPTRFGIFRLSDNGQVEDFSEKPQFSNEFINGGYFFFEKGFENYIASQDQNCIFEQSPLVGMSREKELFVYRHEGFWQCMDTMREKQLLEKLYESRTAPWTAPLPS